jgi:hypothetical protein
VSRTTGDAQSAENARPRGRPTTYVQELYRLREAGELDGPSARALDVMTYVCHLADRYGRDAVFQRQGDLVETLRCKPRTLRDALPELSAHVCSGGELVWVQPYASGPAAATDAPRSSRSAPAFPAEARWGRYR